MPPLFGSIAQFVLPKLKCHPGSSPSLSPYPEDTASTTASLEPRWGDDFPPSDDDDDVPEETVPILELHVPGNRHSKLRYHWPISLGLSRADREERFMDAFHDFARTMQYNEGVPEKFGPPISDPSGFLLRMEGRGLGCQLWGPTIYDHFGVEAETVYNTGHRLALQHARDSSVNVSPSLSNEQQKRNLRKAYQINKLAEHFLKDRFTASFLQTPCRAIMRNTKADDAAQKEARALLKEMFDEDSRRGLMVRCPSDPVAWTVFGDTPYHPLAASAIEQLLDALQASSREVYEAFLFGAREIPDDQDFAAWQFAPILASVRELDNFPPMFDEKGVRRED